MKLIQINTPTKLLIVLNATFFGAILLLIGLFAPEPISTSLGGATGWATMILVLGAVIGIVLSNKEINKNEFAISFLSGFFMLTGLTLLFWGYFLYIIFQLEAYNFAASSLIFDFGTSCLAISILSIIKGSLVSWFRQKKKTAKK